MERGNFVTSLTDTASAPEAMQMTASSSTGPFLLSSGYAAANTSPSRAYLYWPSTRGRVELNALSIAEIQRRVRWLCANFGFARRLVMGMSKLIGTITPYPNTGNDEWDELVFRNLEERAYSDELFDASGKFDLGSAQYQLDMDRFRDGDALVVPTEPEGFPGVQFMFYEGPQIRNRSNWQHPTSSRRRVGEDDAGFLAGVLTDGLCKHIAYRIQDGIDPDKFFTVPRSFAFYYANWESHRAIRGVSILAHAVTNMIDVLETRSYQKKRIKENAATGKVIEQDQKFAFVGGGGGFGGPILEAEETLPDGSKQKINWELVMGGGSMPELDPGQRIKIVADDRPTPNVQEFEKSVLHDCVEGTGLPYQALCDMSGLYGPGIRYKMAEIRRWASDHLRYKAKFVRWYCALHVANEIEYGRLPRPKRDAKNPDWWRHFEYIGQPDMTIDEGRMGNLLLINLESGLATWGEQWGAKGRFWKRALDDRILEVKWAKDRCAAEGLELSEVFPKLVHMDPLALPPAQPAKPGDKPREAA